PTPLERIRGRMLEPLEQTNRGGVHGRRDLIAGGAVLLMQLIRRRVQPDARAESIPPLRGSIHCFLGVLGPGCRPRGLFSSLGVLFSKWPSAQLRAHAWPLGLPLESAVSGGTRVLLLRARRSGRRIS